MSARLRAQAQAWLQQGQAAQWVEVVQAQGSVPREVGTRMLVSEQEVLGTIGGGHLEWQAIAKARARLNPAARPDEHEDWPVSLGPTLGQCCGGALVLRFSALSAASLAAWPAEPPRFVLQLHGAGHVGRAIAKLLADLPCEVLWVDERDDEFPAEPGPPHIHRCATEQAEAEVARAPTGAFFLVLTHRHDLDLRITEAILRRDDFAFFGLIGSASKRAGFERRLRDRGIPAEALPRMHCPIGLAGLSGKAPEVLAISVVAQLLQASSQ
ncbi:xanthine dehydrogenase accessory protein XdhC [Ideonella sp.]|uniref:xanthine dehydrogenase accessory protein XdhC n=1 Tax=Ideonella sp. TaxID=1929293 RepID=UPI003BB5C650